MGRFCVAIALLVVVVAGAGAVSADTAPSPATLVVGTKVAPPFVIQNDDGSYSGLSIDLWRAMAARMGVHYKLVTRSLQGLIDGVHDGSLDMAIGALTVTEAREKRLDFSYPFYTTGLAIAVPEKRGSPWLATIERLFSLKFLSSVGLLVVVLLLVGTIVWLFERRRNPDMFGGSPWSGIGHGLWWAAVTMTTVGYGDKAPMTLAGRIVGLIWMFTAVIVISSFTAAIATSLTVNSLQSGITGPDGLRGANVAALAGSSSAVYLAAHRISFHKYTSIDGAVQALANGQVAAVVHDAPLLQYLAETAYRGRIRVLPGTFERQNYAFALATGSPLRESINVTMLAALRSPAWADIRYRYLGGNASH